MMQIKKKNTEHYLTNYLTNHSKKVGSANFSTHVQSKLRYWSLPNLDLTSGTSQSKGNSAKRTPLGNNMTAVQ